MSSVFPFKLVSADSHIVEPPDLWTSRLDRRYRDRAPQIVSEADSDYFVCEGALSYKDGIGLLATRRKYEEPGYRGFGLLGRWKDVPAGGYDPEAKLKEMDAEGVEAELLYASFGLLMYSMPDAEFQLACFRAFNNWLAEFCRAAPKRLFAVAMIPPDSVEHGVAELKRCAKMGMRGAMISIVQDSEQGYDNEMWNPLWSAAEDLAIPLSLHVAASKTYFAHSNNILADFVCGFTPTMFTVSGMIFSGLFDRHPKLKVLSVENDASWPLAILERIDDRSEHDLGWAVGTNHISSGRKPSAIFHEHVGCTFMRDRIAIQNRNIIGRGNIMWGSDYPHFDGAWPKVSQLLAAQFDGVSPEDQEKIGRTNVIDFYDLPI